jgi:dipeptidyl aminopeptidase/acylaminoacyl peptidase
MKPISGLVACLGLLLFPPNPGHAQPDGKGDPDPLAVRRNAAPRPDDEPDLVITPNSIRIQSTEQPKEGRWVVMPGFSELGSPCFSGDGEWIAFDAYKQGYNNSPSECWIARKDGRDLKRLAIGATPRWSPDGKRLLFMRDEANDPKRRPGIFVIDRDGTGRRLIADGDCPSWSPDGKKIASCLKVAGRPPVLYAHDLATGKDEMLGIGWYRANWMPDSKSVVANGIVRAKDGIVRLSLDTPGKPEELATEFEEPFSPCCSRDGKQIIFIARRPK